MSAPRATWQISAIELRALRAIRGYNAMGFTGVFTGRSIRVATMRRLGARGFVRQESMVVSDGDGFTKQPERWRTGWILTPRGKRALLMSGRGRE
ncbi:MAG TPA: hypothetical protein VMY76_00815 [Gemmatimonadales bacterium]|nr:hypothetical protein [Gemmatimonadales bacterium]